MIQPTCLIISQLLELRGNHFPSFKELSALESTLSPVLESRPFTLWLLI